MKQITSTVISISIHREGDNPIFGDGVLNLKLCDEGSGGFFIIESPEGADIRIDPDELLFLANKGKEIMKAYELRVKK